MREIDYKRLPNPLISESGTKIETQKDWETVRRPEILRFFTEYVYGKFPDRPGSLTFRCRQSNPDALDGDAIFEEIEVSFSGAHDSFTFPFYLFLPKNTAPVGVSIFICNRSKEEHMDITRKRRSGFWPVESIVARGYATCAFYVEDIDTDTDDGFVNGVHHCFSKSLENNDWGTISAWAWAAMRIADYLETDDRIDKERISVVGHSRGGKTALFCAASDIRFSAIFSSNSGCVGTALSRFKDGESVKQINTTFPYWFCKAFKEYNDKEFSMPYDQHELLCTIAPRLLYVTSATEDLWADPESEYLSTCLTKDVYSLYGMEGIHYNGKLPEPGFPVIGSAIGYHIREGIHDLTESDWNFFLDFLDKKTD